MHRILAALFLCAPLAAQAPVAWEQRLDAAMARARAEHKPIFLDLYTEWCPPCRFLQARIFPEPEAQKALQAYVPLAVMVERKDRTPLPEGKALAERYGLDAYPTLLILDAEGRELRRKVGAFRTAADFAAWLGRP